MSIGTISGASATVSLDENAAQRTLPPVIDGDSDGGSWQIATDPHAQSADGKLLQASVLAAGDGVFISRERGDGYDGIIVTTTNRNDRVSVTQRADGTQDVTVNGQTTNIRLARGQQLEIRTEGGDDVVEVDNQVTKNVTVYAGEGNDELSLTGGGSFNSGSGSDPAPATGQRGNMVQLSGESGDDTINAFGGADAGNNAVRVRAFGNDGNDRIAVTANYAGVSGGGGDDDISVLGLQSRIGADTGNDRVRTYGKDAYVDTGGGSDQVEVDEGNATVSGDRGFINLLTGEYDDITAQNGAEVTVVPRK